MESNDQPTSHETHQKDYHQTSPGQLVQASHSQQSDVHPTDHRLIQPVFTSRAHIFEIDPKTKQSWVQLSDSAVPISLILDPTKKVLHLTGHNDEHRILDSIITLKTTFTRTALKFAQWTDSRASTVYGLGFSSDLELSRFAEKFEELKESLRYFSQNDDVFTSQVASQSKSQNKVDLSESNGNGHHNMSPNVDSSDGFGNHHRSQSFSGLQSKIQPNAQDAPSQVVMTPDKYKTIGHNNRTTHQAHSVANSNSSPSDLQNEISQLRYERDRLKLALEQSSANAKEWQAELQKLRTNNIKLTKALQESKANVNEWKRQMAELENNNSKYQARIVELEKAAKLDSTSGDPEALAEFEKDLEKLVSRLYAKLGYRS